jgi:formiminotetrahydrofolate cyclodeaminase
MGFSTSTCTEFVEVLASKAPVPGGGGASALVGAVGTALGNMVGSLTVGKKKYADVEDEMYELKAKCDQLQKDFLRLIERDAEVFEPLSKAYGMPKETEEEKAEKARVMEIVLKDACSVPMEIMEKCCEAIELIVEFGAKGSRPPSLNCKSRGSRQKLFYVRCGRPDHLSTPHQSPFRQSQWRPPNLSRLGSCANLRPFLPK